MSAAVVADTHAIIWYLAADLRLSDVARLAMETATKQGEPIFVPTICVVETVYLAEKNKVPIGTVAALRNAMSRHGSALEAMPLTLEIAFALSTIERAQIPDLPDRVIVATALALQLPLVTRDSKIRSHFVKTIW